MIFSINNIAIGINIGHRSVKFLSARRCVKYWLVIWPIWFQRGNQGKSATLTPCHTLYDTNFNREQATGGFAVVHHLMTN